MILGDKYTQFIDEEYKVTNLDIVILRYFYFPETDSFYVIETDGNLSFIRNLDDKTGEKELLPISYKEKLRGKINF